MRQLAVKIKNKNKEDDVDNHFVYATFCRGFSKSRDKEELEVW